MECTMTMTSIMSIAHECDVHLLHKCVVNVSGGRFPCGMLDNRSRDVDLLQKCVEGTHMRIITTESHYYCLNPQKSRNPLNVRSTLECSISV